MATKNNPERDKPQTLFLSPELTNHLISTLALLERVDADNRYAKLAGQMKQTILKYSKKERRKGDDRAAIILYGKESSALIMLLTIYISTFTQSEPHDFFSDLGKNIRE